MTLAYYCYCVAGPDPSPDLSDVGCIPGGGTPYAVSIGGMQAVVSRVPRSEYCEESLRANFGRMDWVESAVLSHEQVVEGCLRQTDVIPMGFCTIFRSEGDLVAALTQRREELTSKLLDLKGKQEWGVRLVANRDHLRQHLLDSRQELLELRKGAASRSAGASYFLKKRLEDRLVRAMEQARADAAQGSYARLAAVATRAALLKTAGAASSDCEPVLNAAFLVTEEQLDKLLGQATEIVAESPWLRCEPNGPWPPYSFV